MKPYGQKKKKSKLGVHSSDKCGCEACNNSNWKVEKSRERISDIQTKHLEDGDVWLGYSKSSGVSVIGKTEDHCITAINDIVEMNKSEDLIE